MLPGNTFVCMHCPSDYVLTHEDLKSQKSRAVELEITAQIDGIPEKQPSTNIPSFFMSPKFENGLNFMNQQI